VTLTYTHTYRVKMMGRGDNRGFMNDSRQGYQGGSHQYGTHQRYGMGQHPRHPQQMMPPLMQRSQSGGAPHVMGQHPQVYGRQTSAPPTGNHYGQRTMMMGEGGMPKSPERQVSFDMSDFPSLGGEAPTSQTNTYANHAAQQRARFNLQNESFPALPGSGGDSSRSSKSRNTAPKSTISSATSNSTATTSATTTTTAKTASSSSSSSNSRYGLLGLLNVIRMTDPDLSTLALGKDLTSLGLNLNSPDSLHATFASPWASVPTKSRPTFSLPSCYYIKPPALNYGQIKKFQLETLFFIFYGMPRDVMQGLVAEELYRRNWRFHKDSKLWFHAHTQTDGTTSGVKMQYVYFDCNSWQRQLFKGNAAVLQEGLLRQEEIQVTGVE